MFGTLCFDRDAQNFSLRDNYDQHDCDYLYLCYHYCEKLFAAVNSVITRKFSRVVSPC